MNILTFTSLYPNPGTPQRGVFVENRLRYLVKDASVKSIVVSPLPWFPFARLFSDEHAKFSTVKKYATRHDITIRYSRYLHLPKIGMIFQPFFMAISGYRAIKDVIRNGHDFDLIDAHYFYPDGVAAVIIAGLLKKPVVITARGTDINLIPRYYIPKKLIQWAAKRSTAMITVCQALKDSLVNLGADARKVTVLRNGVDLNAFSPPVDRTLLREAMGVTGKTLLSVGYLISRKGHDLVIRALAQLPDMSLIIAGDGPLRKELEELVEALGLTLRVKFVGAVPHDKLADYYGAADILILASSREGWANVLLESMACGTPVVATEVWGTPEVVNHPVAGRLCQRSADSIAEQVRKLLDSYPDRSETRKYAETFSWDDTTNGQKHLFTQITTNHPN